MRFISFTLDVFDNVPNVPNDLKEGDMLSKAITMEVEPEKIIEAVRNMKKKERDSFLEDLLAATSPEYLKSIRDARDDYSAGRVRSHEEVFGR
jgi:hypothetical protein